MRNLRLKRFIANGGVVAYPTESCFGLGCDPRNFRSIKRLNILKKRPANKNFILISSELEQNKGIIEDFILSMKDEKKGVYGIHSVKPKKSNFFTKRFL